MRGSLLNGEVLKRGWSKHGWLLLLLSVAWLLRIGLAARGGTFFFPDEWRFLRSVLLFSLMVRGHWGSVADLIVTSPDHTGYVIIGSLSVPVTWIYTRAMGLSGTSSLVPPNYFCLGCQQEIAAAQDTLWTSAAVLALASVASIALVYAVARKSGAELAESLVAAILMAGSNAMFYYSRHLLPYDVTLALSLLALWIGLERRVSWRRSFVFGLVTGLAFLTYNGYWSLILAVALIHLAYGKPSLAGLFTRGISSAAGFALLPLALTLLSLARGTQPFVLLLAGFGGDILRIGDRGEGWLFTAEYLWHAEHDLLLFWIGAAAAVAWLAWRGDRVAGRRGLLWLGVAAGLCVVWAIHSSGLDLISHFGRRARVVVPFLCLMAASLTPHLAGRRWRGLSWAAWAGAALALHTVFSFAPPLSQQFPRDVYNRVQAQYGEVARDVSVEGPLVGQLGPLDYLKPVSERAFENPSSRYVLLNVDYLYPVEGLKAAPAGRAVFSIPQPFQYLAYQYEGLSPAARAIIRSADISMRLIDTQAVP